LDIIKVLLIIWRKPDVQRRYNSCDIHPHGAGGVGIIRISGDKAFEIAERIFRGKKDFKLIRSHTINYGKIVNPENGAVLDEVLLSKMENQKHLPGRTWWK